MDAKSDPATGTRRRGIDILRDAVALVPVPANRRVLYEEGLALDAPAGTPSLWCARLVHTDGPQIGSAHLLDVAPYMDEARQEPYVSLLLNEEGATRLEKLSGENIGKTLVFALGDEVIIMPVIRDAIPGGKVSINLGRFPNRELHAAAIMELVLALRSGPLAQALVPIEGQ